MTDFPYHLALELHDAGFPQGGDGTWVGAPDAVVWRSGDTVYAPTLSELIEAFGGYSTLSLEMKDRQKPDRWAATASRIGQLHDWVHGSTPEEAVAHLWLALNRGEA